MSKRHSGILLHITSLPSPYGIGDFGPEAYRFADWLNICHQYYWQILPLSPTDTISDHSPYSSLSAFALNPLFVSPELLIEDKLVSESDAASVRIKPSKTANYDHAMAAKESLFQKAFENFQHKPAALKGEFEQFCEGQRSWLEPFALYMALKQHYQNKAWWDWPQEYKLRNAQALSYFKEKNNLMIDKLKFKQFILFKQWFKLRDYCREKQVHFFGDMPIYVNLDSVDVWSEPQMFKLDEHLKPAVVAGVPPDYFSQTGQRWGNPVYNWNYMKEHKYSWWIKRIAHHLTMFDCLRIDHFRAFVNYWEIPADEPTAVKGQWQHAPTDEFFQALRENIKPLPIIAEDLGMLDDQTRKKIDALGFPGMKILIFAFGGDLETHPYLPHNCPVNTVIYTGTHDNNTARGWYTHDATKSEKKNLLAYAKRKVLVKEVPYLLIELALRAKSKLAIIPLQDILGLGQEARMNFPGEAKGNWRWRFQWGQVTAEDSKQLLSVTKMAGRV